MLLATCAQPATESATTPEPPAQAASPKAPAPPPEAESTDAGAESDPPPAPEPSPPPDPGFSDAELARIDAVQTHVAAAAKTYALDPHLLNGLIWIESRFRTRAKGPAGARGIMQIMPRTGKSIAKKIGRRYSAYDPEFGIFAGAYYLGRMLRRFDGDETLGLAAYNRGPGVVAGWESRGEPVPERTQGYVDRVQRARARFVALEAFRATAPPQAAPAETTETDDEP